VPEAPAPPAADATEARSLAGSPVKVLTPQFRDGEAAHYAVIEAEDLIPSHSPDSFTPNEAYPAGVQEREYHRDPAEKLKVEQGAALLKPELLLTDTPTAVDGPPLVTPGAKALVMGGNGRSMMLQRALRDPGQAQGYRAELMRRAATFGVDPDAVARMKAPVLVRVLEGVDPTDPKSMAAAVRRTNEALTQELSPRARAVAEARQLDREAIGKIGAVLASREEMTLREAMAQHPVELAAALTGAGVITPQNRSAWLAGDAFTDEGKDRLEGMFLGLVVGSADRLAAMPAELTAKVERLVTPLMQVEGLAPQFSLIPALQEALDLRAEAKARRVPPAVLVAQRGLFGADRAWSATGVALLSLLEEKKQRALAAAFTEWAGDVAQIKAPDLFAPARVTPEQATDRLFGKDRLAQAAAVTALNQGAIKGFSEQRYPVTVNVRVTWPDGDTELDQIKGLNPGHALHLARENWPGARVDIIEAAVEGPAIAARAGESVGSKTFAEQKYPTTIRVRVFGAADAPFEDEVKGLNSGHALARAAANWPAASRIEVIRPRADLEALLQGARGFMQRLQHFFRVVLNPNADLTTFLHEAGHVFLEILGDLNDREDAPQQVKNDWQRIVAYLGSERTAHWPDGTPTFPTEAHEKWARAFEAWLLEGKAPSAELERPFDNFKLWMQQAYANVAALHVELNDEIRGVFERMLATDEELAAGIDGIGGLTPLFLTPEAAGMSEEDFREYVEAREKAVRTATRQAEVRVLKERLREKEQWWKDEARKLEDAAEKEYDELPDRRAWQALHGQLKSPDGKSLGPKRYLDVAEVRRVLSKDDAKRFPTKRTGGRSIDDVAAELGYASGAEMLRQLAQLADKKTWVAARVQQQMEERHPGLLEERAKLREVVQQGVNGPYTLRFLLKEWAALRKRAGDEREVPLKVLHRTAQIILERLPVSEAVPYRFLQKERAAAERCEKAAAKGRFAAASAARQQQILNMLLHGAAIDLREEMDKVRRALSRTTKEEWRRRLAQGSPDVQNPVFLVLHDAILRAAGIVGNEEARAQLDKEAALTALTETEYQALLDSSPFADGVLETARDLLSNPRRWLDLRPEGARAVKELIFQLRAMADHRVAVQLDETEATLDDIRVRLASELQDLPDYGVKLPDSKELKSTRGLFFATLGALDEPLSPQTLLEQMGSVGSDIWHSKKNALDTRYRLAREVLDPLIDLWKAMPKELLESRFKDIPGLELELPFPAEIHNLDGNATRDRLWLIMVALNMGNRSNRARLLIPFEWEESQVLEVLNKHLTKAEWDFVQSIWEACDEKLWPALAEKERRKRGLAPEKIPNTPIETAFGSYRGGYFPARYDFWAGKRGARRAQLQEGAGRFRGGDYQFAATPAAHRNSRAKGFTDVIDLSWNVVPTHFASVIHDIAFDEFVRDVGRVFEDDEIRATIRRRFGPTRVLQLEQWLVDEATAQSQHGAGITNEIERFTRALHQRSVVAALGWSFTVAAADLTNPLVYLAKTIDQGGVAPLYALYGYLQAIPVSPWGTHFRDFALEHSQVLRQRNEAHSDRQRQVYLKTIGRRRGGARASLELVQNTVWYFQDMMDKLSATAIWLAKYRFELSKDTPPELAARLADDDVGNTLPSPEFSERPQLQRRPGFLGALLAYAGWFLQMYDMTFGQLGHRALTAGRRAIRSGDLLRIAKVVPLEATKWAAQSAAMLFFSNVAGELLSGRGPEGDEPWEDWATQRLLASPASLVPLVGGFAEKQLRQAISGKHENYSWRAAPSLAFFEDQATRIGKLLDSDSATDEQVFASLELALTGAKLGVVQPARTFRAFYGMMNGEIDPLQLQTLGYGPESQRHPRKNVVTLFER
jgi:hypothetical protein